MVIIIILTWKTINIISLNSHLKRLIYSKIGASQVERVVKNLTATAGDIRDAGLMFGPRRSPGEGHGNLLQYSCLENSMDKKSLEGYRPWGCRVRHDWNDVAHIFYNYFQFCVVWHNLNKSRLKKQGHIKTAPKITLQADINMK